MMSTSPLRSCTIPLGLVVVLLVGCSQPQSEIEVLVREPGAESRFVTLFERSVFREWADGDLTFAAHSPVATRGAGAVQSWVYVHVYHRPVPGFGPAESQMTNARVHYTTQDAEGGRTLFSGTGYLFPKSARDGRLIGNLERSLLTADEPGDPRQLAIVGTFAAELDAGTTRAIVDEARIELLPTPSAAQR